MGGGGGTGGAGRGGEAKMRQHPVFSVLLNLKRRVGPAHALLALPKPTSLVRIYSSFIFILVLFQLRLFPITNLLLSRPTHLSLPIFFFFLTVLFFLNRDNHIYITIIFPSPVDSSIFLSN